MEMKRSRATKKRMGIFIPISLKSHAVQVRKYEKKYASHFSSMYISTLYAYFPSEN